MSALSVEQQEQLTQIKSWWQDNRAYIVGVVVVVAIVWGINWGWHNYQKEQINSAAELYDRFERATSTDKDSPERTELYTITESFQRDFADLKLTSVVTLHAAKHAFTDRQYAKAKDLLQWLIDHHDAPSIVQLAQLRLANVLAAMDDYQNAQNLFEQEYTSSYQALAKNGLGDLWLAQGDYAKALESFTEAVATIDQLLAQQQDNRSFTPMLNRIKQSITLKVNQVKQLVPIDNVS